MAGTTLEWPLLFLNYIPFLLCLWQAELSQQMSDHGTVNNYVTRSDSNLFYILWMTTCFIHTV